MRFDQFMCQVESTKKLDYKYDLIIPLKELWLATQCALLKKYWKYSMANNFNCLV